MLFVSAQNTTLLTDPSTLTGSSTFQNYAVPSPGTPCAPFDTIATPNEKSFAIMSNTLAGQLICPIPCPSDEEVPSKLMFNIYTK